MGLPVLPSPEALTRETWSRYFQPVGWPVAKAFPAKGAVHTREQRYRLDLGCSAVGTGNHTTPLRSLAMPRESGSDGSSGVFALGNQTRLGRGCGCTRR